MPGKLDVVDDAARHGVLQVSRAFPKLPSDLAAGALPDGLVSIVHPGGRNEGRDEKPRADLEREMGTQASRAVQHRPSADESQEYLPRRLLQNIVGRAEELLLRVPLEEVANHLLLIFPLELRALYRLAIGANESSRRCFCYCGCHSAPLKKNPRLPDGRGVLQHAGPGVDSTLPSYVLSSFANAGPLGPLLATAPTQRILQGRLT